MLTSSLPLAEMLPITHNMGLLETFNVHSIFLNLSTVLKVWRPRGLLKKHLEDQNWENLMQSKA